MCAQPGDTPDERKMRRHATACFMKFSLALFLAIAYRYYSAFIATRIWMLDDARKTPAHTKYDGANFYPTTRWVLFGHHFAAITGAGPLSARCSRRSSATRRASSGWSPALPRRRRARLDDPLGVDTARRQVAPDIVKRRSARSRLRAASRILFMMVVALAGLGSRSSTRWPTARGARSPSP